MSLHRRPNRVPARLPRQRLSFDSLETRLVPAAFLYVSTQGNDLSDGSSPALALRNIATAMAKLAPGDTLEIEGGTYFEHVVTKVNGTTSQPITIASYNGVGTLDGSTQSWAVGADQNLGVLELRNSNYLVSGLKVVNSKDTGIVLAANSLTITGCEIASCERHGVSTDTNFQTAANGTLIQNVTLTGNNVHNCVLLGQGYGQAISLIADGFSVAGNTVANNRTEGIDIWLSAKHGDVTGNIVTGNGSAGIFTDGASYVRIAGNTVRGNGKGIGLASEDPRYAAHDLWVYNNIVQSNAGPGLFLWDDPANPGFHGVQNVIWANNTLVNNSSVAMYLVGDANTIEILNNLVYGLAGSYWSDATHSTVNQHNTVTLSILSGFLSAATNDLRLTSTSPAINQGSAIPVMHDDLGNSFTVSVDILGRARSFGGGIDAGAVEFQPYPVAITLAAIGPNPAVFGQAVQFTINVAGGIPAGETLTLKDTANGNAVVGSAVVSASGVATISISNLDVGTHSLFASYAGSVNFAAAVSNQVAQTIAPASPPPQLVSEIVNGADPALLNLPGAYANQHSMVRSVQLTFDNAVTLSPGAVMLSPHAGVGTLPEIINVVNSTGGTGFDTVWNVTFAGAGVIGGSIADGEYDLNLDASKISDQLGQHPAAAASPLTFYRLFGDSDGNRVVNGVDIVDMRRNVATTSFAANYLWLFDADWNGTINVSDLLVARRNFTKVM